MIKDTFCKLDLILHSIFMILSLNLSCEAPVFKPEKPTQLART